MTNKHLRPDERPVDLQDDLERDPGISESKGIFAGDTSTNADLINGDDTAGGDIDNDAGIGGGINPEEGRDH